MSEPGACPKTGVELRIEYSGEKLTGFCDRCLMHHPLCLVSGSNMMYCQMPPDHDGETSNLEGVK